MDAYVITSCGSVIASRNICHYFLSPWKSKPFGGKLVMIGNLFIILFSDCNLLKWVVNFLVRLV